MYLEQKFISKIVKIDELKAFIPQIVNLLKNQGFRLIRVKKLKGERDTMQFMVEKIDLTALTVEDCAELSRSISPILDIKNPIKNNYLLEISSPGIERPLIEPLDFERYKGNIIKLKANNSKNEIIKIVGLLTKFDGKHLEIVDSNTGKELSFSFNNVLDAHLVFKSETLSGKK